MTRIVWGWPSGTSSYLRDGVSPTSPLLADGSSAYTPGISVKEGSQVRFQHSGLKNIDFQSRTNNNLGSNRIYDAFGALTADNGNAHIGGFGYGGGFGYQGDPDSGLMLLGHRYYDPSTGRFLTRDPIKDGRNWYVYCENNPLRLADPDGLQSIDSPTANWPTTLRLVREGYVPPGVLRRAIDIVVKWGER